MKYFELIWCILLVICSIALFVWMIVDKAAIFPIVGVGALSCLSIYLLYYVYEENFMKK